MYLDVAAYLWVHDHVVVAVVPGAEGAVGNDEGLVHGKEVVEVDCNEQDVDDKFIMLSS